MSELPTKTEIITAVINGCRGLPSWAVGLNIEEALRDYDNLALKLMWEQELAEKLKGGK